MSYTEAVALVGRECSVRVQGPWTVRCMVLEVRQCWGDWQLLVEPIAPNTGKPIWVSLLHRTTMG